ncbi:MAG TPA: hypothetical protein VMV86_02460 [Methanosarcinales archaeon]|nr:hypothetical protein [Methanosarcinales archaeon]
MGGKLEFIQKDGRGGKSKSEITKDGEDTVIATPWPPLRAQKTSPFRQYLTDDGLTTGSNDMGVDGSVTPVDFWIPADPDVDRYITTIGFTIGYGTSSTPYEFADKAGALTNGCRLFYESIRGEVDIHDAIKSNQDLFALSFTNIQPSWEIRHLSALNDYGFMMSFDLTKMGLPYGIKLDRGTRQRLVMCIKDDATDADTFIFTAIGFERFE